MAFSHSEEDPKFFFQQAFQTIGAGRQNPLRQILNIYLLLGERGLLRMIRRGFQDELARGVREGMIL